MVFSLVNSNPNATRIGWNIWEIDSKFALGILPGWRGPARFCGGPGEVSRGRGRGSAASREKKKACAGTA